MAQKQAPGDMEFFPDGHESVIVDPCMPNMLRYIPLRLRGMVKGCIQVHSLNLYLCTFLMLSVQNAFIKAESLLPPALSDYFLVRK